MPNEFETIATFTLPTDMVIAKTKLESEGIECLVRDEWTVQSYHFISNAIGGVKLQVRKSDFEKANAILQQGGFVSQDDYKPLFIERKLNDPIFVNRIKKIAMIFFVLLVVFLIASLIFLIIDMPSGTRKLTSKNWCLDHVVFGDEVYYPYTHSGIKLIINGRCNEPIIFHTSGDIVIPGFESKVISGNWWVQKDLVRIAQIDTLSHMFEGWYKYRFSGKKLVLESGTTQIVCVKSI